MRGLHISKGQLARTCKGSIVALLSLGLASCRGGVLDPLGPVGADDATILIDATLIMLAIVDPDHPARLLDGLALPRLEHQGGIPARTGPIPGGSRRWSGRSRS